MHASRQSFLTMEYYWRNVDIAPCEFVCGRLWYYWGGFVCLRSVDSVILKFDKSLKNRLQKFNGIKYYWIT